MRKYSIKENKTFFQCIVLYTQLNKLVIQLNPHIELINNLKGRKKREKS